MDEPNPAVEGPPRQAGVLTDPGAHHPARPQWTCDADGEDWPCRPYRKHLLATQDRIGIAVEMDADYQFAARELDTDRGELYRRFYGWIRS